jgi:hypothetical protein
MLLERWHVASWEEEQASLRYQNCIDSKSFPIVTGEHEIWNACSELTRHTEHNADKTA